MDDLNELFGLFVRESLLVSRNWGDDLEINIDWVRTNNIRRWK